MDSTTDRPRRGYAVTLAWGISGVALIALMILGVVASSGNLSTGPRVVDDNQIFSLSRETSKQGFRPTLRDQLVTRARMGRLLPVFLAEKVLKARVYGARVGLWKALARSRWVVASAIGLLGAGLAGLFLLRDRFRRWYVGFDHLDDASIVEAGGELTASTGVVWMVPALAFVLAMVALRRRRRPEVRRWLVWLGVQTAVALLFVAPQVVLYSRLGFAGPRHPELSVSRYLVPAACGTALLVVALVRASREILAAGGRLAPSRRLAAVVPAALLVLGVAYQARAAHAITDSFAATTRRQNDLIDLVRLATERNDPILVVYDSHHRRVYHRLSTVLKGYVGRTQILAFPVAGRTPWRQALDREIRERTLARLREAERLPGAIVIEDREHVREALASRAKAWFRPECHRLFAVPRRYAVYMPGHCPEAFGDWQAVPEPAE